MTASTRKAPAKPTAPKAAKPAAPAKPTAPKPGPAKPPAPAKAPAPVVPNIEASVAASLALGNEKKAESFRRKTMAQAVALGYKVSTEAPFDNVVIIEKGDIRFRVTYSVQDYVRKVEGSVTILPGEKFKWIRLNKAIAELANA